MFIIIHRALNQLNCALIDVPLIFIFQFHQRQFLFICFFLQFLVFPHLALSVLATHTKLNEKIYRKKIRKSLCLSERTADECCLNGIAWMYKPIPSLSSPLLVPPPPSLAHKIQRVRCEWAARRVGSMAEIVHRAQVLACANSTALYNHQSTVDCRDSNLRKHWTMGSTSNCASREMVVCTVHCAPVCQHI